MPTVPSLALAGGRVLLATLAKVDLPSQPVALLVFQGNKIKWIIPSCFLPTFKDISLQPPSILIGSSISLRGSSRSAMWDMG